MMIFKVFVKLNDNKTLEYICPGKYCKKPVILLPEPDTFCANCGRKLVMNLPEKTGEKKTGFLDAFNLNRPAAPKK